MIELALVIASLLAVGGAFIRYQIHQKKTPERLKNWQRLIAWCLIFSVCLLAFYLGLVGITVLVFGIMIWAGIELHQMLKLEKVLSFSLASGVVIIALLAAVFLASGTQSFFFLCLISAVLVYYLPVDLSGFAYLFYNFCILSLGSVVLLAVMANRVGLDEGYLLLSLFFIVSVNDIAQYVVGKLLGKTQVASQLSPKKTLEGVLGGMLISALLCGILLPTILPIDYAKSAALGGLLGLAGFLGDLNVSRIKRALNLKDTGATIIGHGGLFDRIDSLLLVVPVFGSLLVLMGYL